LATLTLAAFDAAALRSRIRVVHLSLLFALADDPPEFQSSEFL
jgi:hypothetical protein